MDRLRENKVKQTRVSDVVINYPNKQRSENIITCWKVTFRVKQFWSIHQVMMGAILLTQIKLLSFSLSSRTQMQFGINFKITT
jgi:hypothetical protein